MSAPDSDDETSTPEPQPVVPASVDANPSSTGVIAGDASEVKPATPPPDAPEEPTSR
jgi:hypothetical protein